MTDQVQPLTDVAVQLTGEDGNAFAILGRVRSAMYRAGVPGDVVANYMTEAMAGDYDHLLQTTMRYVRVDGAVTDTPAEDEDEPDAETLELWMSEGGCEATDGCWVEPDGTCPHGRRSWLLVMGMI